MAETRPQLNSQLGNQLNQLQLPQRAHGTRNAERTIGGTNEQLDLSALPLTLDSRGFSGTGQQKRPRLRDFLKPSDATEPWSGKRFHYPFLHNGPASPLFGPPQMDAFPPKSFEDSSSEKQSSEHPLIPLPKFMISLRNFVTRFILEWWILELLSWVVSALCMCSLVVVFAIYDKQKIPQWHFGLTLNALISALAGIAKSALLVPTFEALGQLKWNWFHTQPRTMIDFEVFDSASRGPWGSLMLLTRTQGRYVSFRITLMTAFVS